MPNHVVSTRIDVLNSASRIADSVEIPRYLVLKLGGLFASLLCNTLRSYKLTRGHSSPSLLLRPQFGFHVVSKRVTTNVIMTCREGFGRREKK